MDKTRALIIQYRKLKGWKPAELARKTGLSPAAISDIESGKKTPSLESLMKFAQAFGVDVTTFLPQYDKENSYSNLDETEDYKYMNSDIVLWATDPENKLYLEFAYNLSKKVKKENLINIEIIEKHGPMI